MSPTPTEPVGYESKAVELTGEISSALDRLVSTIAWEEAKKACHEAVKEDDIRSAVNIALAELHEAMKQAGRLAPEDILSLVSRIAALHESPSK